MKNWEFLPRFPPYAPGRGNFAPLDHEGDCRQPARARSSSLPRNLRGRTGSSRADGALHGGRGNLGTYGFHGVARSSIQEVPDERENHRGDRPRNPRSCASDHATCKRGPWAVNPRPRGRTGQRGHGRGDRGPARTFPTNLGPLATGWSSRFQTISLRGTADVHPPGCTPSAKKLTLSQGSEARERLRFRLQTFAVRPARSPGGACPVPAGPAGGASSTGQIPADGPGRAVPTCFFLVRTCWPTAPTGLSH